MPLALARKYRPRRFADVAVQTHVATTLRSAIEHDRVAQAYLFCGPRGTGKTTLARVLAMALNCEKRRPDREPCGDCPSCDRIWAGSASLDVVEIDAASNRGVDDARDLRERAMYAPTGDDRYKVYIIDEAHMLTKEAWNALLKIIEEPPPRVVFVFATTEPQKIANQAAPILSRVQRFDLRRMSPHDVRERLITVLAAEQVTAEPDALVMLARAADGSMRDALSLTDQVLSLGTGAVTAQLVRETLGLVHDDEILGLLTVIAERRAGDVFTEVARLSDHGADFGLLLAGVTDALRGELAIALGAGLMDLSERMRGALEAAKGRFSPPDLLRMLHLVVELEPHFRRSAQQQLLFETILVRFALLDRTVDLEDVLRGLPAGGGALERPRPPIARVAEARPTAMLADAPPAAGPPMEPVELNRLAGRWDDVVEAVRASGRGLVASSLAEATPHAVANGVVTIHVASEALQAAIDSGAESILTAMRTLFTGIQRVVTSRTEPAAAPVRAAGHVGQAGAGKRMTEADVTASRVAMLRKGAPLLDAAFDTLDLRLVD
ncbi:MAG: DNA polymerase III subunit gamma/tau [Gemmatimonadetes bacterium]|nr:DNA polymerase III subunit gamma/tau [Gemmatimonadota bacterium]